MQKNRTLNVALVGCGGIAKIYRHRYTQIEGVQLKQLVDMDEETLKQVAEELKVERWSTDFKAALADDIDVVDISTPNHLHAEQAIAAMNAGKHVILQKPIAPSVKEAEAIIETARRTGRRAGMYMSMFDGPVFHDIKRMVDTGLLGAISTVHCRDSHKGGLNMKEGNWRNSLETTGGGAFIQLAIHPVNMAQYLIGSKVERVMAFSKNMMCPNVGGDDVTTAVCEFGNGVLGTVEAAYCAEQLMLTIYGTRGFVRVINLSDVYLKLDEPFEGETIKYEKPGEVFNRNYGYNNHTLGGSSNPYDQHVAFIKAILEDKPVPVPVETGLYDLKIVQAVYKSAKEKRCVEISEM